MSWMQTQHWIGAAVAGLVCGVAASILVHRIMRSGGKPTRGTWYCAIRAFPPACVVGALVFLAIVQPGGPEIVSFTVSPQRVARGEEIVLRVETGDDFDDPGPKVEFFCAPRGQEKSSWRRVLGCDEDGSDGWEVRKKTDGLEPGEYTVFARARTDYAYSEEVTAALTVEAAPGGEESRED